MTKPSGSLPCSSAQVPMWRGATATYPCAAINCEDSICPASGSASPPFTTFSSPGLTARRQRSAFSVRSRARCLRRFWTQWNWRLRLCVHLEKHKVADPLIEAPAPKDTARQEQQALVHGCSLREFPRVRAAYLAHACNIILYCAKLSPIVRHHSKCQK